jgi:kynurenine 3-monooxygenase
MVLDIGFVHEIAIPMDKRAIHWSTKLNNYGQEGESIYSISRGVE